MLRVRPMMGKRGCWGGRGGGGGEQREHGPGQVCVFKLK